MAELGEPAGDVLVERRRPHTDTLLDIDSGACLGSHPLRVQVVFQEGPPSEATLTLDYRDGVGFLASVALLLQDELA